MSLGSIIRDSREKKKWLQGDLAEKCFVSQSHISRIERDSLMPNFDLGCLICENLNLNIYEVWNLIKENCMEKIKQEWIRRLRIKRGGGRGA